MSNKKILLVFTNARSAEKIYNVIPELSKLYKLDLYMLGEFSPKTRWWGDNDTRFDFVEKNKKHFDEIIEGEGFIFHGDDVKDVLSPLDLNKYHTILLDGDHVREELQWPILYRAAKKKGILVIGNHHGNSNFGDNFLGHISKIALKAEPEKLTEEKQEFYKTDKKREITDKMISIDKVFCLGEKERIIYNQLYNDKNIIKGGIPTNDTLKNHLNVEGEHILLITNFLGNHGMGRMFTKGRLESQKALKKLRNKIFPHDFDDEFVPKSGLIELSKKYNKKIVIKQKTRFDDPRYDLNVEYIKKVLMHDWDGPYEILTDKGLDIDEVIAKSFIVISAASTLAFKPIQLRKPTVIIEGTGQIGNFYDYNGIVPLNKIAVENEVERQLKEGPDLEFIKTTLEGGLDFNATEIYVNNLKKVIDEHTSNL